MRRMIATVLVFAVLSATAAGCKFSKVSPNAVVHITGRALDANGRPLAGIDVRLFKEADLGEVLLGSVAVLGTLGTACLLPAAPTICAKGFVATTGDDGRYSFTLNGSDTQGTIGTASTLDVVFAAPGTNKDRASTTLRFTVDTTKVVLPAVRLWQAGLAQRANARHIQLTWHAVPASAGDGASYAGRLLDPSSLDTLWSQPATAHGTTVDARVLEDHPASAVAAAMTSLPGGQGAGSLQADYLSEHVPVMARAGVPPSRNRPCLAVTGTTRPATTAQTACGATDGNLTSPARLTAHGKVVTGVVVDLGRPRAVHLVVVRGVAGMYLVEISTNGRDYRTIGSTSQSIFAVAPPGGPLARYVRVRSPSGLDESFLDEVSVW